jgi:hypothetical protein
LKSTGKAFLRLYPKKRGYGFAGKRRRKAADALKEPRWQSRSISSAGHEFRGGCLVRARELLLK